MNVRLVPLAGKALWRASKHSKINSNKPAPSKGWFWMVFFLKNKLKASKAEPWPEGQTKVFLTDFSLVNLRRSRCHAILCGLANAFSEEIGGPADPFFCWDFPGVFWCRKFCNRLSCGLGFELFVFIVFLCFSNWFSFLFSYIGGFIRLRRVVLFGCIRPVCLGVLPSCAGTQKKKLPFHPAWGTTGLGVPCPLKKGSWTQEASLGDSETSKSQSLSPQKNAQSVEKPMKNIEKPFLSSDLLLRNQKPSGWPPPPCRGLRSSLAMEKLKRLGVETSGWVAHGYCMVLLQSRLVGTKPKSSY